MACMSSNALRMLVGGGYLRKLINLHHFCILRKFEDMVINMDHCMDRDFPEHVNDCVQHYPPCDE